MCNCKCSPEASSDTRQQPTFEEPSFNLSFWIASVIVLVGAAVAICGFFADNSTMSITGLGIMGLSLVWVLAVASAGGEAISFYKARYGPDAQHPSDKSTPERKDHG